MQGVSLQIIQVVIPITMFALMFGMGLTLTFADFKRVLSVPKAVIIGLLLQLIALPAIAFALSMSFELATMLAVGLVAVAACPGGTMSNILVHMGKGDTALSITLTATATLVTLFTLPMWVIAALSTFGESVSTVEIPVLKTGLQLGMFTILPVIIGMFARLRWPVLIDAEPKISKLSTAAMVVAFIAVSLMDENDTLSSATALFVPATIYVVVALVLGYGIPRISGLDRRVSSTVAVETSLKNILLSMFVATNTLNSVEAAYASVVIGTLMLPVAIGVMVAFNMSAKREARMADEAA